MPPSFAFAHAQGLRSMGVGFSTPDAIAMQIVRLDMGGAIIE